MSRNNHQNHSLYTPQGQRKYISQDERQRFLAAARQLVRQELMTFCTILAYTGCRISEALELTSASVQPTNAVVAIRCLKKRGGRTIIREVPLPQYVITSLTDVHKLHSADCPPRLWHYSRSGAWRLVKRVMKSAGIRPGPHATPKGLRHGFGIHAICSGVPLTLIQKWLGHSKLSTTTIYLQAVGTEERLSASRMWKPPTNDVISTGT